MYTHVHTRAQTNTHTHSHTHTHSASCSLLPLLSAWAAWSGQWWKQSRCVVFQRNAVGQTGLCAMLNMSGWTWSCVCGWRVCAPGRGRYKKDGSALSSLRPRSIAPLRALTHASLPSLPLQGPPLSLLLRGTHPHSSNPCPLPIRPAPRMCATSSSCWRSFTAASSSPSKSNWAAGGRGWEEGTPLSLDAAAMMLEQQEVHAGRVSVVLLDCSSSAPPKLAVAALDHPPPRVPSFPSLPRSDDREPIAVLLFGAMVGGGEDKMRACRYSSR